MPLDPSFDELEALERLLESCEVQAVRSGSPLPLGAHARGDGVNFALFSRHATGVRLDLFEAERDTPARTIILDALRNKTGDIWHVWLKGIAPGQLYGFRVAGPYAPHEGHRFNPNKLVLDPCAKAIVPPARRDPALSSGYDPGAPGADLSFSDRDNAVVAPRCVVPYEDFDWQGDQPLRLPWSSMVVYELHVRGFTIHPSAAVAAPGTYSGLVEKIPYLRELGVTAVELMPVQEFDEEHNTRVNPRTGERLKNFWGYDPLGFFAAKASYASVRRPGAQVLEFQEMVRAFHRAGIEVILDVVFNHTGEGSELGPTVCFRGVDNAIYYWLADDRRYYRNFTGTGQTVNASHPVVRDLILDALRYWVMELHVDGFRFDLASVLGRDARGVVRADAPLLERIAEDPILRDAKLIAEAWDAAGAYQVGSFSHSRWAEWNGRFRDDVRRFWRGDAGLVGAFASRICGSADLYAHSGKGPECSVNFVTCHDGFTLNDLVSYARKHNEENGEGGRDGSNDNHSAAYGEEGPSTDPAVEQVRERQIRNFVLTLAVSRGVPMILGGDEFRRTQRGNNNAYCQDNDTSWVDWSLASRHAGLVRFVRQALALRRAHPVLRAESFYTSADVEWRTPDGSSPAWNDPAAHSLGCLVHASNGPDLFLMFHAGLQPATFALPAAAHRWTAVLDTAHPSLDADPLGAGAPLVHHGRYTLPPRSAAVLVAS